MQRAPDREDMIHVSALNQYLYCPRRLWYYRFYNPSDRSPDLVEGQAKHKQQARQKQQFRDQYFVAPSVGLHGRIDLLDTTTEGKEQVLVPVERKRASSGQYYWNDEVQLAGYCMLLEEAAASIDIIDYGYIYLYSTDQRHKITITDSHRTAVQDTIDAIKDLDPSSPPEIVDNSNKCQACSIQHRCLPATVSHLQSMFDKTDRGQHE